MPKSQQHFFKDSLNCTQEAVQNLLFSNETGSCLTVAGNRATGCFLWKGKRYEESFEVTWLEKNRTAYGTGKNPIGKFSVHLTRTSRVVRGNSEWMMFKTYFELNKKTTKKRKVGFWKKREQEDWEKSSKSTTKRQRVQSKPFTPTFDCASRCPVSRYV